MYFLKSVFVQFLFKKDKALSVDRENVELKVDISSFCSGLKLCHAAFSVYKLHEQDVTWRRRNNGKFCYVTFDEYSKYTLFLNKTEAECS